MAFYRRLGELLLAAGTITQEELDTCFEPEIERMSGKNDLAKEKCLALLKKNYEDYRKVLSGETKV